MRRVVKQYVPPHLLNLHEALEIVGSFLFQEEWATNAYTQELPFYVRKEDFGNGKEWCMVRRKLRNGELKFSYYDLPDADRKAAFRASKMCVRSFETLLSWARSATTEGSVSVLMTTGVTSVQGANSSAWITKVYTVLSTGFLPVTDGYALIVIERAWLDSEVASRVAKQGITSLQSDETPTTLEPDVYANQLTNVPESDSESGGDGIKLRDWRKPLTPAQKATLELAGGYIQRFNAAHKIRLSQIEWSKVLKTLITNDVIPRRIFVEYFGDRKGVQRNLLMRPGDGYPKRKELAQTAMKEFVERELAGGETSQLQAKQTNHISSKPAKSLLVE